VTIMATQGKSTRPGAGEKNDKGQSHSKNFPATQKVLRAQLVFGDGLPRAGTALLDNIGVERDARSKRQGRNGKYATSVKGIFAAGTGGVVKVSWYGHSMKGAVQRVNAINFSWAGPTCA